MGTKGYDSFQEVSISVRTYPSKQLLTCEFDEVRTIC